MAQPSTKAEVIKAARNALGAPIVGIEIDAQNEEYIYASAERWFIGRKGQTRNLDLPLVDGVQEYLMPADCDTVVSVDFPPSRYDGVKGYVDDFGLQLSGIPIGGLGISSSPGTYSMYTQYMMASELRSDIIGSPCLYEYVKERNMLVVGGSIPGGGIAMVKYKSKEINIPVMEMMDFEIFVSYVIAEMKCVLGRILRKHMDIPGASGSKVMDGDSLYQEGIAAKQELNDRIRDVNGPGGFFMG